MALDVNSDRNEVTYSVTCRCGTAIEATAGQAGCQLVCSKCGASVVVPPLSTLRQSAPAQASATQRKRPFQYRLKALFLVTLGLALVLTWAKLISRHESKFAKWPADDYWVNGTVNVRSEIHDGRTYAVFEGKWPDATDGQTIRLSLWYVNKKGNRALAGGLITGLRGFTGDSPFYERPTSPVGTPYRVVAEYEIWDGQPDEGTLQARNRVISQWYEK